MWFSVLLKYYLAFHQQAIIPETYKTAPIVGVQETLSSNVSFVVW